MIPQDFQQKKQEFIIYLKTEKRFSAHTVRAYASDLQQLGLFWLGLTPVEQKELPFRQVIERFLVAMHYKKVEKGSIARKLSCIKSFERYLKQQHGIHLKLRLKRPKVTRKLPVYLSIEEIAHVLDEVPDSDVPSAFPVRDKTIFELLYATGIRCSELVNITMADIDMENKTIRILGKGNKERIVLFGQKAKDKLLVYLSQARGIYQEGYAPLFVNSRGNKMQVRAVQRIFEMFRSCLNVERNLTPHKLRHSFATHLLNKGADLRVVQELLGHATLASTEVYTHVSLEELIKTCQELHPINALFKKKKE